MPSVAMQRSSSAGPVVQTNTTASTIERRRIEKDYKQRHNLKKVVTYDTQVAIARSKLNVGNPKLREAIERDNDAAQRDNAATRMERRVLWKRIYAERNAMHFEDRH